MKKVSMLVLLLIGVVIMSSCNTKKGDEPDEQVNEGFLGIGGDSDAVKKAKESFEEYELNTSLYKLHERVELQGPKKHTMYNITSDTLNGLKVILEYEVENSDIKVPEDITKVLKISKYKNYEYPKTTYMVEVPANDTYKEFCDYLKSEYGEVFFYDMGETSKKGQYMSYIYSHKKDPNVALNGSNTLLEVFRITLSAEGKTRRENMKTYELGSLKNYEQDIYFALMARFANLVSGGPTSNSSSVFVKTEGQKIGESKLEKLLDFVNKVVRKEKLILKKVGGEDKYFFFEESKLGRVDENNPSNKIPKLGSLEETMWEYVKALFQEKGLTAFELGYDYPHGYIFNACSVKEEGNFYIVTKLSEQLEVYSSSDIKVEKDYAKGKESLKLYFDLK